MSQFTHNQEIKVHRNSSRGESALGVRTGGRVFGGITASSYWITPAISNVSMAVTSIKPSHLTLSMNFVNSAGSEYAHRGLNIIDFPRLMRFVRILGMMAVISYMTVILFTWMYANLQGYVYFSAGEPALMIKYPEWVLGVIGIFAAIDLLRKELDEEAGLKKVL